MKRILLVTSSLHGDGGRSTELARELVEGLGASHPGSRTTTLDLDAVALPHLGAAEFASWAVPAEERSPRQAELAARSDKLVKQLLEHDTLVLAMPMYNLAVPSTFKSWIDRVVRAGKTFRYTDHGPVGLVKDVDAYVVFARGGVYHGTPMDSQTGYVRAILGLIGIDKVETVYAEGLAMGEARLNRGLAEAREAIASLAGQTMNEEVRYASA